MALWDDMAIQRWYFDWALQQLFPNDYTKLGLSAWYNITSTDALKRLPGSKLIELRYDASLVKALETVYPQHNFMVWKFEAVSSGFWAQESNRRAFFQWLVRDVKQSDLQDMESFYELTIKDVQDNGGMSLLATDFDNSLSDTIMATFPEHKWQPWRFVTENKKFWMEARNQRRFLLEGALPNLLNKYPDVEGKKSKSGTQATSSGAKSGAGSLLGNVAFINLDPQRESRRDPDVSRTPLLKLMYTVSPDDLKAEGGRRLVAYYKGSVSAIAKTLFPEFAWDDDLFKYKKYAGVKQTLVRCDCVDKFQVVFCLT